MRQWKSEELYWGLICLDRVAYTAPQSTGCLERFISMSVLADYLTKNAARLSDQTALVLSPDTSAQFSLPQRLTWTGLNSLVGSMACVLRRECVGSNSPRLSHLVQNSDVDLLVSLACYASGVTECPIDAAAGLAYREDCIRRVDSFYLTDALKTEWLSEAIGLHQGHLKQGHATSVDQKIQPDSIQPDRIQPSRTVMR